MLTCDDYRELLLEADLELLRQEADGPLADHLRDCADCRRRAERVLADHESLARALIGVETAYAPAARRRFTTRRAAAILLSAAAAAGALFFARSGGDSAPLDPPPAEVYAALHPARPVVETPPGMRAAIITTDQALTLVLLYPGDDR